MRPRARAIAAFAGAAALAGPVCAQETSEPKPSGPLASVGQALAQHGVTWRALLTNEYAANPYGGVRQSANNVGQFYLGADIDLDKAIGLTGARFHATVYRDYGSGLAHNNSGTFVKQQDIYKNEFPQLHLGLFAYQQRLLDDRLDIMVGHLGSTAYYGHLWTNCFFQAGATCGVPAVLNSEAGFSLLPSATWGANIRYRTSQHTYVNVGAFEVNPFIAQTHGFDFSVKHATGVTVPIEFGYENNDPNKVRYPAEFKVGYYASTGDRNDPFFNTEGQSRGLHGGTPLPADTLRQGAWVMGDKTVWRPDPDKPQSLTLFGGWIQPFEGEEVMDRQVFGGALWRAPLRARPHDTVGLNLSWLHLTAKERAFLRDARIRAGGSGTNKPNEFVGELNYGFQVSRSTRITPNLQYVVNPDNSLLPDVDFVPKDMLVLGLKVVVNVADLLGLPSRPLAD